MADNFSKWLGGPNFIRAQQWGVGKTNSGEGTKIFGNAGMRRRLRFNPNPTRCSFPSCIISKQSVIDKAKYRESRKNASF